jgi:hypothetical protein
MTIRPRRTTDGHAQTADRPCLILPMKSGRTEWTIDVAERLRLTADSLAWREGTEDGEPASMVSRADGRTIRVKGEGPLPVLDRAGLLAMVASVLRSPVMDEPLRLAVMDGLKAATALSDARDERIGCETGAPWHAASLIASPDLWTAPAGANVWTKDLMRERTTRTRLADVDPGTDALLPWVVVAEIDQESVTLRPMGWLADRALVPDALAALRMMKTLQAAMPPSIAAKPAPTGPLEGSEGSSA